MEEVSLIMFSRDECIFKQYHRTNNLGRHINREIVIIPKDGRQGAMISRFQSREFSFGIQLTTVQLLLDNTYHANPKYVDQKVATSLRRANLKETLKESFFV